MRSDPARARWFLAGLLLALALPALAHEQQGQASGFLNGLRHPASGLDHVLAMITVGLWGAHLGLLGVSLPGVEVGIALSAILLGFMVAREARPPLWVAVTLVGLFAIFHGHAHGTELPSGESALLYSMGFVVATGCLHAIGIGIGAVHRWSAGRIALRIAGAAVAFAGCAFLWRATW
jgi:urease accessory protein